MDKILELSIPTPEGLFLAQYSEKGLCGLNFPGPGKQPKYKSDAAELPQPVRTWHGLTKQALADALAGKAPKELPPLDLSAGTTFQQSVWQAMRAIGLGQTLSYGQIAHAIGKPKAVRAVGGACGANPIPVFVPCHRVLAANRRIGGFSGGLDWKRKLLVCEGIEVRE
jgi:O-6-methylguanine DNA methyltransferase